MADQPIVSIQLSTGEIQNQLQELERRLSDLTPVYKDIGETVVLQTDSRFREEKDPNGIPWKKLSPYTLRLKAQQRRIQKILQSTGRLRASITYQADRKGVTVGTNVSYAAKHQLGGKENGRVIPQRQFLGIGDVDKEEIIAILNEWLDLTRK
jgi:phage virion morphogenesis protein